jgi:excisionase family DNA binding protein
VPHAKKAKVRFKDRRAYSLAEVAGLTGLAISTLYKLIASGRLKTRKIAGRRIVPAEALDELLDVGAVSSWPAAQADETSSPAASEIVARADFNALAQRRIASAPPVAATRPRQLIRGNRETNKAGPLPTATGLQFCFPRSRENNEDDDT